MRAMECACGRVLEASDEKELFGQVRDHMNREHPEKEVGDEQILNLIEAKAYDASQVEGEEEEKDLMDTIKDKLTGHQ